MPVFLEPLNSLTAQTHQAILLKCIAQKWPIHFPEIQVMEYLLLCQLLSFQGAQVIHFLPML